MTASATRRWTLSLCVAAIAAEAIWASGCAGGGFHEKGQGYVATVPLGHPYANFFCMPITLVVGPLLCVIMARTTRLRRRLFHGAEEPPAPPTGYRENAKPPEPSAPRLSGEDRRHFLVRELTAAGAAIAQAAVGLPLLLSLASGDLLGFSTVYLAIAILATTGFLAVPRGRHWLLALPLPLFGVDFAVARALGIDASTVLTTLLAALALWMLVSVLRVRKNLMPGTFSGFK